MCLQCVFLSTYVQGKKNTLSLAPYKYIAGLPQMAQCRRLRKAGSLPGWEDPPEVGNGNPLQWCLPG